MRILVAMLLGGILSSCSNVQNLKSDSTPKGPAAVDTLISAKTPPDSLPKKGTDTVVARKETAALRTFNESDSAAVRQDTSSQQAQTKDLRSPEPKNLSATASSLDPNGYKDTHWGMTLQDVHKYIVDHGDVDENDLRDITNGFEYTSSLAGIDAAFAYQFDNDRLFIVRLTPKVKATSKFDFLDSFDDYRTILEAKYGKPARSGFSKVDESYLSTIESIQLGFAKKYVLWEFDHSYIVLALIGRDRQLGIHITYVSRTIFDEMTSRIETLKLEDF
jgi:hypothetical protein